MNQSPVSTQRPSKPSAPADPDHCRICRSEGTPDEPLYHPCKCSGSIKFVHQDCLMEWLQHSQKKYCELCKTPFTFTKVYDPEMPSTLPMPLFFRQLARHFGRNVVTWFRGLLVAVVWLGWLPWCVRWMWRGWFWMSDGGWWVLQPNMSPSSTSIHTAVTEGPDAATQTSAAVGRGILGFLSSPGLSAQMSPVNGGPSIADQVANVTIGPTLRPVVPTYQGGIFFENNPFETATQWPAVNRAIIDIIEGELLTALIVVSFIIVFLIREWVVTQQPGGEGDDFDGLLIDEAPPDNAAEQDEDMDAEEDNMEEDIPVPAGQDVADEEDLVRAFGPIPLEAEVENDNAVLRPRRLARPRRRRAFGPEEGAEGAEPTPAAVPENEETAEESTGTSTATMVPLRPTLTREATAQASNFRRDLEETNLRTGNTPSLDFGGTGRSTENLFQFGSSSSEFLGSRGSEARSASPQPSVGFGFPAVNVDSADKDETRGKELQTSSEDSTPEAGASSNKHELDTSPIALSEDLKPTVPPVDSDERSSSQSATSSWSAGSFEMLFPPPGTQAESQDKGKGVAIPEPAEADKDGSEWESEDEDEAHIDVYKPGASNWSTTAHYGDASVSSRSTPSSLGDFDQGRLEDVAAHGASLSAAEDIINEPVVEDVQPRSAPQRNIPEERLRATFNHLGGGQPVNNDPEPVQDPVPTEQGNMWNWVNGALPADPQPAPEPPQAPLPPPPPPPDFNNDEEPDAFLRNDMAGLGADAAPLIPDDDAADEFDGIMELIGMRGPIMGLIQNAAISSVLITATVAIGVAFPYVIGKTVMMILAHPILFFFRFPMAAVSFAAEFLVDSVTMTAFTMLLLFDRTIRFLIKPVTVLTPTLSKTAASSKITSFLKDWAADGQYRVMAKFNSVETTYSSLRRFPPSSVPPVGIVVQDAWERFSITFVALLHKFGLGALTTTRLTAGPDEYNLVGLKIPNPAAWAANAWTDTFSSVNFTRAVNNVDKSHSKVIQEIVSHDGIVVPLYKWTTWDRAVVVLLGYMFFTVAGMIYVRRRKITAATREVERVAIEFLEQCGGVMKVVLIIGIEMFVFPLYCGILLDIAMLPLFKDAGIVSRVQFAIDHPITSIFIHWFIGTCYMFHFALFVSMCRKIMRTGVLCFIRDPDDPTFHPVRDVLDRPVVMQLRKIAFSGFIYGVLVLVCLGGVVWSLRASSDLILPIIWASHEPVLEFPIDLLFYNFLVPIAVKLFKPSIGLQAIYGWWFRHCARLLRLSSFMFGERVPEEEGYHHYPTWTAYFLSFITGEKGDATQPVKPSDTPPFGKTYFKRTGRFVRAPASDSLRRPKGSAVFIPVDEDNHRLDVEPSQDPPNGPTGADSPDWKLVYIPPYFRVRVGIVVLGIWVFAAITGVSVTVAPLVLGRVVLRYYVPAQIIINDVYAFSVGAYICGGIALVMAKMTTVVEWIKDTMKPVFEHANTRTEAALTAGKVTLIRGLKLLYMAATIGIIIPSLIALVIEFYIIIPAYTIQSPQFLTYASNPPTPNPTDITLSSSSSLNSTQLPPPPPFPIFPPTPPTPKSPHTLHFIQDWTLGVLYLKLIYRLSTLSETSLPARLLRAAFPTENYLNPDIALVTRHVVAPAIIALSAALLGPVALAWGIVATMKGAGGDTEVWVYRMAFPACLLGGAFVAAVWGVGRVVERWRGMVRDEVYLRGVRVHNHGERKRGRGGEGEEVVAEVDQAVLAVAAERRV
ncbi:hypothetical protein EX30DRAFT_398788 [Ascodesmis nigricans]|uniref:RING-type E3 ubiquitin transferase n=1 Tax=Ascodesmis nigricans TaxID=341454 RepID=A0A4S2MJQ6_9PEZI|nr:hypothetical protein EX30DRAFT_398788 [Ascodesmis nigricans]